MASTEGLYIHPFYPGTKFIAVSDRLWHVGQMISAVDFLVPEGTPVLAARDGVVVASKDDSKEGGLNPKYRDGRYYNSMTIEHDDGELSQYGHLRYRGSLAGIGDRVKEGGTAIAYSGRTGYAGLPHLHFAVFRVGVLGAEVLKIRWKDYETPTYDNRRAKELLLTPEYSRLLNGLFTK